MSWEGIFTLQRKNKKIIVMVKSRLVLVSSGGENCLLVPMAPYKISFLFPLLRPSLIISRGTHGILMLEGSYR